MHCIESAFRSYATAAALVAFSPSWIWCQQIPSDKQQAEEESIGDAVRAEDNAIAAHPEAGTGDKTEALAVHPPIHILYVHGIDQVGAGDSLPLRKGICKYLGECTVTSIGRVYADGPFAVDSEPPTAALVGKPIWKSKDEWSASAPFIDRYEMKGNGHTPILLDEFNWWPLAYPLKCKWLIARDALLTGTPKPQLSVCATPTTPDPAHPKRYLSYQWIENSEASELNHIKRRAKILNRSLKNGLMDWGFADAVMALGPMEDVLSAGIRELLIRSLQPPVRNANTPATTVDGEVFFVTHSLGSYLALIALNTDLLGSDNPDLSGFQMTPEQKQAADYFSAHTAEFYFLANQIALLQLAWVSSPTGHHSDPCSASAEKSGSQSIAHWLCKRDTYLSERPSVAPVPQIVAWSDPNDLLSWEVPQIDGVRVVNIKVQNPGFKLSPFIGSPTSAHANYAKNRKVLRLILKPSPQH
ncbi:MAG TPA: hypothetical protein VGS27_25015 [Candidatus Sulfotelmatobacter sp.]|nr:hypothetical protein [Candidatus Sulfotelmatobacter sp.]